jgi:hypothetical protein
MDIPTATFSCAVSTGTVPGRMLRYTHPMETNPTSLNLYRWWHA